ncbi:hypothetical protein BUE93_05795 [Chromobacterium amazonense]|uniref:Phage tail protein n=1 Tax=Chromobacterium amazonense TaxID=1382803 RepID=A0A2S9X722_9NEIS|nr:tail assembly protein [Chromobacterium amazonense]PRP71510.1 hypothetical protein BUE93_05795 [Chromobacterium amazonense]
MNTLRKIRLGGELAERFGALHMLAVQSVGETVVALEALHPGFRQALREMDEQGMAFQVTVADRDVTEQELTLVSRGDILIMPVIAGAGGVGSRIMGAALIVAGALTWYMGGSSMMMVGVGLMAGGAAMLLTPVPRIDIGKAERNAGKPSYLFGGAANGSAQGMPVPMGVGVHRVGGIVVSAGVSVEDM